MELLYHHPFLFARIAVSYLRAHAAFTQKERVELLREMGYDGKK